jgi:uncharacterized protein
MVAHSHGSIWNAADPARSLQPWHADLTKRQVKAPKVYVRDSGLPHGLFKIA